LPGDYEVIVYRGDETEEYCRRKFIVLDEGTDLKAVYSDYLNEYLAEILQKDEPDFERIKTYKRGLAPKTNMILGVSGTYREQIFYQRKGSRITFLRSNYDHASNMQSQLFKQQKVEAIAAWKTESSEFKSKWAIEFNQWYNKNYRKINGMMTPFMWYVSRYLE